MYRCAIMFAFLCICFLPAQSVRAEGPFADPEELTSGVTIKSMGLEVAGGAVNVRYQIANGSARDIWLCRDIAQFWTSYESYCADDNETLIVRRRLAVPQEVFHTVVPEGRYIRLAPGKSRCESLVLPLRPGPRCVFLASAGQKHIGSDVSPGRVTVEIGFYSGDLYGRLLQAYRKGYFGDGRRRQSSFTVGTLLTHIGLNEGLRDRNEEIVVQWPVPLMGSEEEVLRMTVDWPNIPDGAISLRRDLRPPDLKACSRIQIRFAPSMLGYFYPFGSQHSLFSSSEREYLAKQDEVVMTDHDDICKLNVRLQHFDRREGVVCTDRTARITYWSGEDQGTLTIFADEVAEFERRQRFAYIVDSPGLRECIAQIQPLELRLHCAANLKDLWHRLRWYSIARGKGAARPSGKWPVVYPSLVGWCDAMVKAYREHSAYPGKTGPHKCPSARKGRSHYAMNPSCRPDSPAETVLLFETKAGWNQHGGPELFTFDNHDPEGGCVLLNDGTVKFIRTEEELHALRWE